MPIPLSCDCGRSMQLKDALAGRKVKCPNCATILAVPRPGANVEDEALDILLADSPGDRPSSPLTARAPAPPPEALTPSLRLPARPPVPEPRLTKPAAKPKKEKRRSAGLPIAFERGWFGGTNAGVLGGLLTMFVALVILVVGLLAGRIFFYMPILMILGFISFIKGLMNRE